MIDKLRLFTPLRTVWAFGSYDEPVDAYYKFDRGINKTNMFGANKEYYKQVGFVNGHNGLDIECPDEAEIVASHDGWVRKEHDEEKDRNAGFGVEIVSDKMYIFLDGSESYVKTIYWHNKKNLVNKEDKVKKGQAIALADNTGFSTGTHLHFGLKKCDKEGNTQNWLNGYYGAIDPYPYLQYWDDKVSEILIDDELLELLYEFGYNRKPDTDFWKGKDIKQFLKDSISQSEHKNLIKSFRIGSLVIKLFRRGGLDL